jgi:hypothetical protein
MNFRRNEHGCVMYTEDNLKYVTYIKPRQYWGISKFCMRLPVASPAAPSSVNFALADCDLRGQLFAGKALAARLPPDPSG